ncbi:MAG: hypothetical protein FWG79_05120 [Bacteroidales bacterium]|nr:hypothetical protein [Bacteroidales bacterium]
MKTILSITALSLLTTPLFAQYLDAQYKDQYALAFTMPSLQGNARYVSMGGAFGALGGNLSALSTNPASIGIYRSSEFSFTPSVTVGSSATKPLDITNARVRDADRMNFNMGNFGYIAAWDISKSQSQNEWKMLQFGIGLNRLADFWNRSSYTGLVNWTYLDELTREANQYGNVPIGTIRGVAWDAKQIYEGETEYNGVMYESFHNDLTGAFIDPATGAYSRSGSGLTQNQYTETSGAINEWAISFGGNYGDVLYLGATLGVPVVNFRQNRRLTESDAQNNHTWFREWKLEEELRINGNGINLKVGATVRPTDFMRIGVAIHTPTRFVLTENLTIRAGGDYFENGSWKSSSHRERLDPYEYNIRTPMKLIGSLGFVIGHQALIGIEYEHLNYGKMRVGGYDASSDEDNDFIVDNYGNGGVLRVGGEYRFDPVSLRAGYNFMMDPYHSGSLAGKEFFGQNISAGIGFVAGLTTIDLGYVYSLRNYQMKPYPGMTFNQYDVTGHQFLLTVGWRF